jgi:hypothetical protein
MTMLVTLDQALRHLRLGSDDDGSDEEHPDAAEVEFKAGHASEIVLDYCTHEDKDDWTDEAVPASVQAAVLIVLSDLWEHRAGSSQDDVFLSVAAKLLLTKYRAPTLA